MPTYDEDGKPNMMNTERVKIADSNEIIVDLGSNKTTDIDGEKQK